MRAVPPVVRSFLLCAGALLRLSSGGEARRLSRVAEDPSRATADDLALLVRAHGVSGQRARVVVDRLTQARMEPELVWRWTMNYDANELAGLCASRLTDRELVAVLDGRRRQLSGIDTWIDHEEMDDPAV